MSSDSDVPWSSPRLPTTFGTPRPLPRLNPHSVASDNLIGKSLLVWDTARDRAIDYIERAARFPYDNDEESFPVLWAAHMSLFCDVTDAAEDAELDDRRWLDAALEVLGTAEEAGRIDLGDVLRTIANEYTVSRGETAAIEAACASIPPVEDPVDPALAPEVVLHRSLSILATTMAYRAALSEAVPPE
ncbi:hypothetical protein [Humibacter antri]